MEEIPYAAQKHALKATRRGSSDNASGRFERLGRVAVDDGWQSWADPDLPPLTVEVSEDTARTVISWNDSPDIPFDRSINPYRGCEHGCSYCFARPTHAYLGLSPGMDFETRLLVKSDAAQRLVIELRAKSYKVAPIAIGTNTDAYQPLESRLKVMRRIVEVLSGCRHPLTITTKSALVARDADLLALMARDDLIKVVLSITTLDRDLARKLEPRASPPLARLKAVTALAKVGVPIIVNVAPIIPGLTDHEIENIVSAARDAGARAAGMTIIRLPREVAGLFQGWLAEHAPDRAARVESLIRQTREGQLYQSSFGTRMTGSGPVAALIRDRFRLACRQHGLTKDNLPALRCDLFRPPVQAGDQLRLW